MNTKKRLFLILAMDKQTKNCFEKYVFATAIDDLVIEEALDAYVADGYKIVWSVFDTEQPGYSLESAKEGFAKYIENYYKEK